MVGEGVRPQRSPDDIQREAERRNRWAREAKRKAEAAKQPTATVVTFAHESVDPTTSPDITAAELFSRPGKNRKRQPVQTQTEPLSERTEAERLATLLDSNPDLFSRRAYQGIKLLEVMVRFKLDEVAQREQERREGIKRFGGDERDEKERAFQRGMYHALNIITHSITEELDTALLVAKADATEPTEKDKSQTPAPKTSITPAELYESHVVRPHHNLGEKKRG
jgi:hypothetical protein